MYSLRFRKQVSTMQHTEDTQSGHIELHATPQEIVLLMRAAAIEHLDVTSFVMRAAGRAAQEVVERTEHIKLSERGTLFVLDLLENPPPPNAKLIAAAQALEDNLKRLEERQNEAGMA
jgi:uncharacterized protein (DUF1778 family)